MKESTQRSGMWEKIADTLNKCNLPKFRVDKHSVREHVGILVYEHTRKLKVEEKASVITPDQPTELQNFLNTIVALEESAEADLQKMSTEKLESCSNSGMDKQIPSALIYKGLQFRRKLFHSGIST